MDFTWGLGLQLAGALFGGDSGRAAREQANRQAIADYNRRRIAMLTRRSLGKIQYSTGIRKNLGAASRAVSENNREYRRLLEETRSKQYEIWLKTVSQTGKEAASGMTGKTAKRLAAIRRGQAGVNKALLAQQMTSKQWRLNASTKSIWEEYRSANRQVYDKSGIGTIGWAGPAPILQKGPSFFSRLAPVLGVLGNHYVNQYTGNAASVGELNRQSGGVGSSLLMREATIDHDVFNLGSNTKGFLADAAEQPFYIQ